VRHSLQANCAPKLPYAVPSKGIVAGREGWKTENNGEETEKTAAGFFVFATQFNDLNQKPLLASEIPKCIIFSFDA
jgi:hypothetical protein